MLVLVYNTATTNIFFMEMQYETNTRRTSKDG